jgi:hypothetical protein
MSRLGGGDLPCQGQIPALPIDGWTDESWLDAIVNGHSAPVRVTLELSLKFAHPHAKVEIAPSLLHSCQAVVPSLMPKDAMKSLSPDFKMRNVHNLY